MFSSLFVVSTILLSLNLQASYAETDNLTPEIASTIQNFDKWKVSPADVLTTTKAGAVASIDGKYVYDTINNENQMFVFPSMGLPTGTTIDEVKLTVTAAKLDSRLTKFSICYKQENILLSCLPLGGTPIGTIIPTYSSSYNRVFATAPDGSDWTLEKLNSLSDGVIIFGIQQNTNAKEVRVEKISLDVTYTLPPTITITSPTTAGPILWNRDFDVTVSTTGIRLGDIIQIRLADNSVILGSTTVTDLGPSFTLTGLKLPAPDSPTEGIVAVIVRGSVIATSPTWVITVSPHDISITADIFSDGFPNNSASVIGTIFDEDDDVEVAGLPITFSAPTYLIPPPATNSAGVTITDSNDLAISGDALLVHNGTTITNPEFCRAEITFGGVPAGEVQVNATAVSIGVPINTLTYDVDILNQKIIVDLGSDPGLVPPLNCQTIKEIKLVKFPGSNVIGATVPISVIEIKDTALQSVHTIDFVGASLGTGVETITKNPGRFSSLGVLGDDPLPVVTSSFAGNDAYEPESFDDTSTTQSGFGGSASITVDSGTGIVASVCSTTSGAATYDSEGDYLCDNMEGSLGTDGIPFTVYNYAVSPQGSTAHLLQLPGSNDTTKHIYVESDYMTGHTPNAASSASVVSLFADNGIALSHIIDQMITPHDETTTLWTDTNMIWGDDFDSLKMLWFGLADQNVGIGGTQVIDCPNCSISQTSHTISVSGLTISTPATALTGSDTSGKVVIKIAVTISDAAATITKGIPTVTAGTTGPGVYIKLPMTTANTVVTGSGAIRTFTVTVQYSTLNAVSSIALGTINVPYTTSVATTATIGESGSPIIYSNLLNARAQAYHYIPWLHSFGDCGPSGQGELPGNDAVVSLGCDFFGVNEDSGVFAYSDGIRTATVGNENQQAGTFLHELGHNIGLNHGGPQKLLVGDNGFAAGTSPSDTAINCKPNYISVMSYTRQIPGFLTAAEWDLDLSSGTQSSLIESSLDESVGLSGIAATIVWAVPGGTPSFLTGPSGPINWDGDVNPSEVGISADINNFGIGGCDIVDTSALSSYDWDDWSNLDYNLRASTGGQFDGLLGESTPDQLKNMYTLASLFTGFYNPPPYDDGTSTANKGSTLPLKIRLFESSGVDILAFANLRAEYRISGTAFDPDNPDGYKAVLCINTGTDDFAFDEAQEFAKCDWKIPKTAGLYYLKVWLDTDYGPIPTIPPEIVLIDDTAPDLPPGEFPFQDDLFGQITNKIVVTSNN